MKNDRFVDIAPPLHPILGIAFINFILVIILMIVFFSFFATPSAFEIRMPVFGVNEGFEENRLTIRITGENVLYFNGKAVTINDLKRALQKTKAVNAVIYLRVDRRASMGRAADVWDLCKGLGIARIRIVASPEN